MAVTLNISIEEFPNAAGDGVESYSYTASAPSVEAESTAIFPLRRAVPDESSLTTEIGRVLQAWYAATPAPGAEAEEEGGGR